MYMLKRFAVFLSMMLLSACAGLTPSYETPQVSITSFGLAPQSNGMTPLFNIGVRVVNPNRTALPLHGMTYSVEVEGSRLLSGATSDLPRIEGYGTADFVVQASPDLFGSARLLNQLFSGRRDKLHYRLQAKFDVGGLLPFITIEEKGEFGFDAESLDSTP